MKVARCTNHSAFSGRMRCESSSSRAECGAGPWPAPHALVRLFLRQPKSDVHSSAYWLEYELARCIRAVFELLLMRSYTLFSALLVSALGSGQNITTVAGSGTSGFSGDGSSALTAILNHPTG